MIVMHQPASFREKDINDVDGLQRIDDTDNGDDDDDVPTSQLPRRRNASPEVVCPAKPPQAWEFNIRIHIHKFNIHISFVWLWSQPIYQAHTWSSCPVFIGLAFL